MSNKVSKNTLLMSNPPSIPFFSATVGSKEGEGPIGICFDTVEEDGYFGQDSWEKAESQMQKMNIQNMLTKANLSPSEIDLIFSGDIINQCTVSAFGLKELNIPFLGIFGACSTIAEGLLLAGLLADNGAAASVIASTSSHFSTAERQFRFPLSYGKQPAPTAQWTCTGAGAALVTGSAAPPYIRAVSIGKIVDMNITDANNMGAAMAPAAADTIKSYFDATQKQPPDYDFIVTGDLGTVGSALLIDLLKADNIDISAKHKDCGVMIYDPETQGTNAGGSGCGCGASVLCGFFLPKLQSGEIKNILFVGTGALMSPLVTQQGQSIPAIAHLLHISHMKE